METTIQERKEWLITHRTCRCPDCGHKVPDSLTKYTGYCPVCKRFWRLRRSLLTWKYNFYYPKELNAIRTN